jgi:hypothetical protein
MKSGAQIEGGLSAVPLLNAVFCADCETISNSPHGRQASCEGRTPETRVYGTGDVRGRRRESQLLPLLGPAQGNVLTYFVKVQIVGLTTASRIGGGSRKRLYETLLCGRLRKRGVERTLIQSGECRIRLGERSLAHGAEHLTGKWGFFNTHA